MDREALLAEEAAILAPLARGEGGAGALAGRKRRRDKGPPGLCHKFLKGSCPFGETCRFSHDEAAAKAEAAAAQAGRDAIRRLMNAKIEAAAAAAADGFAGGSSSGVAASATGEAGAEAAAATVMDAEGNVVTLGLLVGPSDADLALLRYARKRARLAEAAGLPSPAALPVTPADAAVVHHPSVLERYYTHMYVPDVGGTRGAHQYVQMHSNRLCVVGLVDAHPGIIAARAALAAYAAAGSPPGQRPVRFAFHGGGRGGGDCVAGLAVVGKNKRGALSVQEMSTLGVLHVRVGAFTNVVGEDGSGSGEGGSKEVAFVVRAGVKGRLIEVNRKLVDDPTPLVMRVSRKGRGREEEDLAAPA